MRRGSVALILQRTWSTPSAIPPKKISDMAALDNFLPGEMLADYPTARIAAALRHAEETEATLYELFPFGLVYETLGLVIPQRGGPAEPGEAAPGRETNLRAALPSGG